MMCLPSTFSLMRPRPKHGTSLCSLARAATPEAKVHFGPVVQDEHEGASDAPKDVCDEALVHGAHALVCHNLFEAIHGAGIEPLLRRLLALHLEAAANGVEGVGGARAEGDRGLGSRKRRDETDRAGV